MKRSGDDNQHGGPDRAGEVSAATREDLALAVAALGEAERQRSLAVGALARVRARGDGEAAVGMPVEQHLRWNTKVRYGTVSTIGTITDVAGEMRSVITALDSGEITLDQAGGIAWPSAKVTAEMRRMIDASLTTQPGWTDWSPEELEFEVKRLLEDLQPAKTDEEEREAAERQYLHVEPTLDGQGMRGHFQAHGLDAAVINATLDAASDRPEPTEPDPDGILVGQHTRRGNQLFQGLMRIFRSFTGANADATGPDITIYAIVDETEDAVGSGELLTARRGLAPRLSAATLRRLGPHATLRQHALRPMDGDVAPDAAGSLKRIRGPKGRGPRAAEGAVATSTGPPAR